MRIEVLEATISFGNRVILEDFSAQFASGKMTALVGPSGSGKSSLLAAMAGYAPLQSGEVVLVDRSVRIPPTPTLVSWVPQGSNALGTRTALENVMVGSLAEGFNLREAEEKGRASLAAVGLDRLHDSPARFLSGGELQRVAIARALASGKPFIFADEPSANLDEANTRVLAAVLRRTFTTATIILATHDPILVEVASAVVQLRSESK